MEVCPSLGDRLRSEINNNNNKNNIYRIIPYKHHYYHHLLHLHRIEVRPSLCNRLWSEILGKVFRVLPGCVLLVFTLHLIRKSLKKKIWQVLKEIDKPCRSPRTSHSSKACRCCGRIACASLGVAAGERLLK